MITRTRSSIKPKRHVSRGAPSARIMMLRRAILREKRDQGIAEQYHEEDGRDVEPYLAPARKWNKGP